MTFEDLEKASTSIFHDLTRIFNWVDIKQIKFSYRYTLTAVHQLHYEIHSWYCKSVSGMSQSSSKQPIKFSL